MTQIDYFLSQADPVLLLLTDRGRDHDGVDRRGVPADPGDLLLLEPGNQLAAGPVLLGWFGHGSPGPPRDPGWLARHATRGSPRIASAAVGFHLHLFSMVGCTYNAVTWRICFLLRRGAARAVRGSFLLDQVGIWQGLLPGTAI